MSFLCKPRRSLLIDGNRVRNQKYEYTYTQRRSVRSICWNLCTDFINVNKFGAFSAIIDKENSKNFRGGGHVPAPPRKRSRRGSSCLRRSLGQNGENVLISDFQMLASMHMKICQLYATGLCALLGDVAIAPYLFVCLPKGCSIVLHASERMDDQHGVNSRQGWVTRGRPQQEM